MLNKNLFDHKMRFYFVFTQKCNYAYCNILLWVLEVDKNEDKPPNILWAGPEINLDAETLKGMADSPDTDHISTLMLGSNAWYILASQC